MEKQFISNHFILLYFMFFSKFIVRCADGIGLNIIFAEILHVI